MRIALSNPEVSHAGGVERVITETASQLFRRGHEVTVYAARVDSAVLDPGVRTRVIPIPASLDDRLGLGFRSRCAAALRADAPDVHGAFSTLSPLGGVFWVPSVHRVGYDFLRSRRGPVGRLVMAANPYHRIRLQLERAMFSPGGCALALAQTDAVRADVRRSYPTVGEVGVLPLGYDDRSFTPAAPAARVAARRRHGLDDKDQVLLFVANELERKGFQTLLSAMRNLPQVRLLGAGRVTPNERVLARSGVADRVRWLGHVADVGSLHAAADAFVLPTRYEPWGLAIVEALGCGRPVITTELAGAAIAVRDGETGILLGDPDDVPALTAAIRHVLSGALADSERIAASVSGYTWEQVIRRYESILAEVART